MSEKVGTDILVQKAVSVGCDVGGFFRGDDADKIAEVRWRSLVGQQMPFDEIAHDSGHGAARSLGGSLERRVLGIAQVYLGRFHANTVNFASATISHKCHHHQPE